MQGGFVGSPYPGIIKALSGIVFPIALIFILFLGGDLFTGNCMYMTMAFMHGKASIRMCAEVLIYSFFTNLAWCLFFDWFLAYKTELFYAAPYLGEVIASGNGHFGHPWGAIVLKGVGANSLVCIGVFLGTMSRSALGKLVLIWIPVAVFVTIGYEHVIANMGLVPIAIMYGSPVTITKYITEVTT